MLTRFGFGLVYGVLFSKTGFVDWLMAMGGGDGWLYDAEMISDAGVSILVVLCVAIGLAFAFLNFLQTQAVKV